MNNETRDDDEPLALIDLGDAATETRQISPFGFYPDAQFNYGWLPW